MLDSAADPVSPAVVELDGVSVRLGGTPVLADVDLAVPAGQVLGMLGGNGAGKSTLIRAVLGLVPVSRGQVRVFGADPTGDRRRMPWNRIGYAPQRVSAPTGVPATAAEVVATGLLDRRRLRPSRTDRARCLDALEEVGLAGRAHESVQILSGGQQQRVLLARALVRDPDLLILDEPLAGIDQHSREVLATTIAGLQERGTTVVLVLHEQMELEPLIHRTVVLHAGRLVHDEPGPAAPRFPRSVPVRESIPARSCPPHVHRNRADASS